MQNHSITRRFLIANFDGNNKKVLKSGPGFEENCSKVGEKSETPFKNLSYSRVNSNLIFFFLIVKVQSNNLNEILFAQ